MFFVPSEASNLSGYMNINMDNYSNESREDTGSLQADFLAHLKSRGIKR
jgi:hypothetical protein